MDDPTILHNPTAGDKVANPNMAEDEYSRSRDHLSASVNGDFLWKMRLKMYFSASSPGAE